jgi:hypothetical protein
VGYPVPVVDWASGCCRTSAGARSLQRRGFRSGGPSSASSWPLVCFHHCFHSSSPEHAEIARGGCSSWFRWRLGGVGVVGLGAAISIECRRGAASAATGADGHFHGRPAFGRRRDSPTEALRHSDEVDRRVCPR